MTKTKAKNASISKNKTKAAIVSELLEREDGASLEAMCKVTGWQAHSCRSFLTGLRKKGREIARYEDDKGQSIYRMTRLEIERAEA